MTRDELIQALKRTVRRGTDPLPTIRVGFHDYALVQGGRRPGVPSFDELPPEGRLDVRISMLAGVLPEDPEAPHWSDPDARLQCGDCGAWEGSLHLLGCGLERCGRCGGQAVSCPCPQSGRGPAARR